MAMMLGDVVQPHIQSTTVLYDAYAYSMYIVQK